MSPFRLTSSLHAAIPIPLLAVAMTLMAQTPAAEPQQPSAQAPGATVNQPYDAHAALAAGLKAMDDADKDVRRFTYILDISMGQLGSRGHIHDYSTLRYETTYINGHPYMRLLEKDGAPLSGADLKNEEKRYEKAIKKKKDLGVDNRANTDGFGVVKSDVPITSVLGPGYSVSLLESGLLDGQPTHVIDATPVPDVKRMSTCLWHLRFWLDDKTGHIHHYLADTKGDTRPECENTYEDLKFLEVDGLPKIESEATRFNLVDSTGRLYVNKSLARYSNYRRFGATVTIRNGDVVPSDTAPDTPKP